MESGKRAFMSHPYTRFEQHVADAANGLDPARRFRIVAQFLAQRGYVHVNRAVEHFEIALRHFEQQISRASSPVRSPRQGEQQIEFLR